MFSKILSLKEKLLALALVMLAACQTTQEVQRYPEVLIPNEVIKPYPSGVTALPDMAGAGYAQFCA